MRAVQRKRVALAFLAAITVTGSGAIHSPYRLLYNPTQSAPRGWYGLVPTARIRVNEFIAVQLTGSVAQLAAQRRYLPQSVPLLKQVAAVHGQRVCEIDGVVTIDDALRTRAHREDSAGRLLNAWSGCRILNVDELFLLSQTSDASFDSRYFGPVLRSAVLGRAIPLWTW